jgi:hypothetical protein
MNSVALPDWVEARLATAPAYIDKRGLAQLFTSLFGPISYRTVEDRPLTWQLHNGYAVTLTRTAVEAEYERFAAAPKYRTARAKVKTA